MEGARVVRLHVLVDLLAVAIWVLAFAAEETTAGLTVMLLMVIVALWLTPWLVITTRPWAGAPLPGLGTGQRIYVTASSLFLILTWIAALAAVTMYSVGLFISF